VRLPVQELSPCWDVHGLFLLRRRRSDNPNAPSSAALESTPSCNEVAAAAEATGQGRLHARADAHPGAHQRRRRCR
jgi:hypothetical protein